MIIQLTFQSPQTNINLQSFEFIDANNNVIPLSNINITAGSIASGNITTSAVISSDSSSIFSFTVDDIATPSYTRMRTSAYPLPTLTFYLGGQCLNVPAVFENGYVTYRYDFTPTLDFYNNLTVVRNKYASFTFDVTSTSFSDTNGVTRYSMVDSGGNIFYNYTTYTSPNLEEWGNYDWIPRTYYEDSNLKKYQTRLKFLSNLANLYEQQAPAVTSIEVNSLNANYYQVTVKLDKPAQCLIYGINLNANGTEGVMAFFNRDELPASDVHNYTVKKPVGGFKVIAIPSLVSNQRDFTSTGTPTNSLNSYSYSVSGSVESRYQEGYDLGYKEAHQQIYSLGQPYGWNYDFNTRTDYGATAVQSDFVSTIADNQYFKAYREVYDRGASYGFTYNTTSTSRSYYLNLRDTFVSTLGSSGSVETYQRLYLKGVPYGFSYNSASTDKTYYQNLENTFISTIVSKVDSDAYKRAYNEVYNAGIAYTQLAGLPSGYSLFVNDSATNPNFATKRDEFVKTLYNSGYAKASQSIFDLGLTYDYDYRTRLTAGSPPIYSDTLISTYANESNTFLGTVTASAQIDGYVDVYNYIATTSGWTYNSQGASAVLDYRNYLANQKANAVNYLTNKAKVEAYEDVFSNALSSTGYNYTSSSLATDYSTKVDSLIGFIYRRGLISGVQNVYDKGNLYNVATRTTYGSLKTVSPLIAKYANTQTNNLLALAEPIQDVIFNDGVVSEARRLYNYAVPYGFTFDNTQIAKEYYFNLESTYIDAFTSGAESVGIGKVFQEAASRYNFTYTSSTDSDVMVSQIEPMFDFVDNKISADAVRGIFNQATLSFGVTYTNSSNYGTLANQTNTLLQAINDQGTMNAYEYVFQQASVRDAYSYSGKTTPADMKSKVVPMLLYVENYKESDGYRRVHNYARNFLGLDYTFQDSADPRVLENQVPRMFEYLSDFGGMGNLRYVLNTAVERYPGFTYIDTRTVQGLKNQIPAMFDFIDSTTVDIENIEGPFFTYPDLTRMKVTLKTNMRIYCVVSNTLSGELLAFYMSPESVKVHDVKLKLRPEQFGPNTKIVFIPAERILN